MISSSVTHPASRESGCALAALRAATREHHARVDGLMDLRRLQERGHYGRVLQALEAFLGPWEQAVAAALPAAWQSCLRHRSRLPFLRQDLRVLGLAPARPAQVLPRLDAAAAAWGSVYVMEGSALGGQVITRAVAAAGLVPAGAGAYFHGWGAQTGAMWHEFRARLQTELADPAGVAAACRAACQTFDAIGALLEPLKHDERPALA